MCDGRAEGRAKGARLIEIQLPKCKVFLTQEEIRRLLLRDRELYEEGIRRGKSILRARAAREREMRE